MSDKNPVRVLQFGEGVFLRGFMNWMIARMNEKAAFGASTCIIKPRPGELSPAFQNQNNRYTIVFKGIEDKKPFVRREINDTIARIIRPYEEFEAFLKEADNPDLLCIVSNTTESGIVDLESDKAADRPASSFPGKLAQFLRRRYQTFNGARDRGLVILPCELIEDNAVVLKEIVLKHAQRWYGDAVFTGWIDASNWFLDTLVDRIVSGYSQEERMALVKDTGFDDGLLIVAEPYHLLAIKGPESLESVLPFRRAGLNVIWADDITPYRMLKLRLLNGNHTFMTLCGLGMGLGNVLDCLASEPVRNAIFAMNRLEVLPCVPLPPEASSQYFSTVLDRFANPYLDHRLLNIALYSVSKWKLRLLPSLLDYYADKADVPTLISFSLAALTCRYVTATDVQDEPSAVAFFKSVSGMAMTDPHACALEVVFNPVLFGDALKTVSGLADVLAYQIADIFTLGMEKALLKASEAARAKAGRG